MGKKAEVTFTVKEGDVGSPPYVLIELHSADSGFPTETFTLGLRQGADIDEAREVAKYLRHHVRTLLVS